MHAYKWSRATQMRRRSISAWIQHLKHVQEWNPLHRRFELRSSFEPQSCDDFGRWDELVSVERDADGRGERYHRHHCEQPAFAGRCPSVPRPQSVQHMYPDRVYSNPEFTLLPSYLFSGADFALIPSHDEPFGLVAVERVLSVV